MDAFPERTFGGVVHQIRLAPQTVQNVVSYTVIVLVENPDQLLRPGMTANATFLVNEARGVLKVPSAALRFRPAAKPGAVRAPGAAGPDGQRPAGTRGGPAVFVLAENGKLHRVQVTPGLSDGTFTAVAADSLQEGMQVVIAATNGSAGGAAQGQVNPFAPGGMTRARRKLVLTHARSRFLFGRQVERSVSPFVEDIAAGLKELQRAATGARPAGPDAVQLSLF